MFLDFCPFFLNGFSKAIFLGEVKRFCINIIYSHDTKGDHKDMQQTPILSPTKASKFNIFLILAHIHQIDSDFSEVCTLDFNQL